MSEDKTPVTPPPDPPADPPKEEGGGLADRVERVEAAVTALISKLSGGGDKPADPGAPATVAEEVQRELARRDEAKKKAEADERLGKVETDLKSLTEKPPAAPVRKIESIMGWHG